jgi:hypothetical protein
MVLKASQQLPIRPVLCGGSSTNSCWSRLGTVSRIVIFTFLAASSIASWAQHPTDSSKTFTAPDGAFSLRYSSQLIQCQQKPQGDGEGYSWIPAENCAAYHAVCDGETGQDYTAIACFAYPRNKFTNTESFEAATFSVEIIDHIANEKDCLAGPPDEILQRRDKVATIHGVPFAVFEFGEAGMSQAVGGEMYRTFHRGKCYQLGVNVATANAQAYDPPAREFTKDDRREVQGRLEQVRDSFQFLK